MSDAERHRLAWQTWRRLAFWLITAAFGLALIGMPGQWGALGVGALVSGAAAVFAWWRADRANARYQAAADAEWEKIRKILEET